jgi:hypothetical protein
MNVRGYPVRTQATVTPSSLYPEYEADSTASDSLFSQMSKSLTIMSQNFKFVSAGLVKFC